MELWAQVLLWSLLGSAISLAAGILLLTKRLPYHLVQLIAVPFAAGSLLAASFLDLLPEAMSHSEGHSVAVASLVGFLLFFVLERFLGWFHHHHEHGASDLLHPTSGLIILGDILHNFIDGLVIGAAFLVDVQTGVIATLAIAAHEIPQEIGDFGLLLALKVRRKNVLLVNIVSAVATVIGAVGIVLIGSTLGDVQPYLLAVAAGFFIYIAASDIIPVIHAEPQLKRANIQTFILIVGIVVVGVLINIAHGFVEPGETVALYSENTSGNVH